MPTFSVPTFSVPLVFSLFLLALSVTACSSDHVSWVFVSSPSGSQVNGGGAVIVITTGGASPAYGARQRSVMLRGRDARGSVTVRLSTRAEVAALDYGDAVDVRCPSLPAGRVVLEGASLQERPSGAVLWELRVPDSAPLRAEGGPARLLVAELGNVLVLDHALGLVVYDGGAPAQTFGVAARVEEAGSYLQLALPGEPPRVLRGRAPPLPADRVEHDPGRGSLRIFGPRRQLLAEVPEHSIELLGGAGGLFLRGDFPAGAGAIRRPFTLLSAVDDRYLVRLEAP